MNPKKNGVVKTKAKKLANSFKYAGQGIVSSFLSERNMKIHVVIMLLVIVMGMLLKINRYEWVACILCFAVVISGELFNTAIETVVDMVMPYKNEKAKLAKDVAAGSNRGTHHIFAKSSRSDRDDIVLMTAFQTVWRI